MLWQSSNALHIGSKLKLVDKLKFMMNIPLGTNNCQEKKEFDICKDIVGDEKHFILLGDPKSTPVWPSVKCTTEKEISKLKYVWTINELT